MYYIVNKAYLQMSQSGDKIIELHGYFMMKVEEGYTISFILKHNALERLVRQHKSFSVHSALPLILAFYNPIGLCHSAANIQYCVYKSGNSSIPHFYTTESL